MVSGPSSSSSGGEGVSTAALGGGVAAAAVALLMAAALAYIIRREMAGKPLFVPAARCDMQRRGHVVWFVRPSYISIRPGVQVLPHLIELTLLQRF